MIKYLITDIDGTMTDGKIYIGQSGEIMKAFSVKDGYAVNGILTPNNIKTIVLTGRESLIVQKRCEELGIKDVYQGCHNKIETLKNIINDKEFSNSAYFGDDIPDMECMHLIKESRGIIGCPADAVKEIRGICDYVCENNAGYGAFREFSEWLISL